MSSYTAAPLKFPRSLRIIKSADYGVLVHTRNENTFRLTSKYFSINAMKFPEEPGRLRFGITVGKRNAHRSVDRALVKRTLREAARKQAPNLAALLGEQGVGLDVSLRLRVPLKEIPGILRGYEEGRVTAECGKETITFEKSEVALVRLRVEF